MIDQLGYCHVCMATYDSALGIIMKIEIEILSYIIVSLPKLINSLCTYVFVYICYFFFETELLDVRLGVYPHLDCSLWDQNWELEDYVQSTDVAPLQSRLFAWIHSQMSRIADALIALLQRCRDSKARNVHCRL